MPRDVPAQGPLFRQFLSLGIPTSKGWCKFGGLVFVVAEDFTFIYFPVLFYYFIFYGFLFPFLGFLTIFLGLVGRVFLFSFVVCFEFCLLNVNL